MTVVCDHCAVAMAREGRSGGYVSDLDEPGNEGVPFNSLTSDEQKAAGKPKGGSTAKSNYFSKIFNEKCKFDPYNVNEVQSNILK